MSRFSFLVLGGLALVVSGCDTDCTNNSRVNGTYAMWHAVLNTAASSSDGTVTKAANTLSVSEDYPTYDVFVNGWTKWEVTYQATASTASVTITDLAEVQGTSDVTAATAQTFAGTLSSSDANCNIFTLDLSGQYEAPNRNLHDFTYTGDLVFTGDHMSGTFTYSDTFSGTDAEGTAVTGELKNAAGEVYGTLQTDGDVDTGFTEEAG